MAEIRKLNLLGQSLLTRAENGTPTSVSWVQLYQLMEVQTAGVYLILLSFHLNEQVPFFAMFLLVILK